MKKDLIFIIPTMILTVLLFLLKVTGMGVHIAVAFAALVLMVVYTVKTKKEWKNPPLEILARVCYLIALITGVLLMKISAAAALAIIHKISAAAFAVIFAVLSAGKAAAK